MIYHVGEVNSISIFRESGLLNPLPRRKPNMHGGRHIINCLSAFDIETSRLDFPLKKGEKVNSHSFMYVWQFQIEDYTIMGRTWAEFWQMIGELVNAVRAYGLEMNTSLPPRLVCYVHNLSYEFSWLAGMYKFKNDDVFFRQARKPLYARMFDCIEFRCSYLQTNMSLAHFIKQMGIEEEKLSGQEYDYDKIRFPWTPLSDFETEYCVRDVRSLVKAMRVRLEKEGDTLQTIPLTSTGYVRRKCKEAIKPNYLDIKDMKPDIKVYRMLRDAFRGGNTHANRKYVNKILDNVSSYDMTSCYPAQQLTKRFPMGKFRFLDSNLSLDRVFKFIGLGYAVVVKLGFVGLKLRHDVTIPYLSLSRTKSRGFINGIDNGRILQAEYCITTVTEIDLKIIMDQYDFKYIKVFSAMVAKKDYLPENYRKVIQEFYERKTVLKHAQNSEEEYQYAQNKSLLNAVFGMSCQDPIHSEILFDGGKYTERNLYDFPAEAEKALEKAPFPYQWGVYITCYAREALQEAIDLAGDRMVYCDTDSVKVIGQLDLTEINKKREKLARKNCAWAKDRKGNSYYMGVFEYEGTYDRFITQGAKKYAFIKGTCKYSDTCPAFPRCKMKVTASGVSTAINEKTGLPIAVEELGCLENFKEEMTWKEAGGTMSVYNDNDWFEYTDPESGKSVYITPNIAILPTTYKMGYSDDYRDLLTDVLLYGDYIEKRK